MALIKCIECGHEVSDKASGCPNCGCPIDIIKNELKDKIFCKINNKEVDISEIIYELKSLDECMLKHYEYIYSQKMLDMNTRLKCTQKYMKEGNTEILNNACRIYNDYCEHCNLEHFTLAKFLYQLIKNNFEPFEFYGETYDSWLNRQKTYVNNKPKCPHCHSTNISKISGTERAVSVIGLGLLSNKINKSFKCKSCGFTW